MSGQQRLFILMWLPAQMRTIIGESVLGKLNDAHSQVQITIVEHEDSFVRLGPNADGILVFPGFHIPAPWLLPGARLRWVQSITAGVNNLLTPELISADHITITATKGPMGPLMAEHVVLLMLALARNLRGFLQDQAQRHWRHLSGERSMVQLYEKTIAILGVGAVGGNLARICKAGFGMHVWGLARTRYTNPYVDRYFDKAELHIALAEADVVALCLPLTLETEHIVDAGALAAMKPGAYLINVARGGLVDEEALIASLQRGHLAGAGLDATAVEPLPVESPLWAMPNVIITPHVAPGRDRLAENMVDFWCENIRRFAGGQELLGVVDRYAGY